MSDQLPTNAPSSSPPRSEQKNAGDADADASLSQALFGWLRPLRRLRGGDSVRDAIEEIIEEHEVSEDPISADERLLLANILRLRDRTVGDVMVPRADVVAVGSEAKLADVIAVSARDGHSRLPVYRGSLDDALGMVHVKDLLVWRGRDADFKLTDILRKLLFVAPSMKVLELLLEMRVTRSHMALVVDEHGGVDGLVTIEDLVEEIVGEIEDEHDRSQDPVLSEMPDGTLIADARVTIEALETHLGTEISLEEHEDLDTLGGLVFSLAGRVPIRGELIAHPAGVEFEVLDADPRRIRRLRVRRHASPENLTEDAAE